jgi:2,4-dienoyl-CoA reductase-like NADH-dependent reductase (Old Yellow Enzyme family)
MTRSVFDPIRFKCGIVSKNRFMLAPLTNTQSHEDGTLSDDEYHWLTLRAQGGFGITMTCASHIQEMGKGFSGQLGIFSDNQIEGHQRLSAAIKSYESIPVLQLHHAGMRSPKELIGEAPICPSMNDKFGARAMSLSEIKELRDDFISAALRAKSSGFQGVEVHGAHGYILTQFLSEEINHRTDKYGGSLENRARILFEIVLGIREECGDEFLVGVRLSPERFGLKLEEVKNVAQRLIDSDLVDFLDISLWDYTKLPEEEEHRSASLLTHFAGLNWKDVKFTVAGKIRNGSDVQAVLDSGVHFVSIGRSAILHHDFPLRVAEDPRFEPISTPVSKSYLRKEGLGTNFIHYMHRWPNFVKED